MRLRFKICKVGSHSNDHVADDDSNHALAEELGNTIVDSDDEYIPGFMDVEDGSDQCFGSGNSTESEGLPVSVSQNMCMKARKIVRNDLVGGMVAHYAKLWDYKEELDKTNPGSTFEIRNMDGTPGEP
ncbi:hypothetical protein Tco_0191584, partial [Tanacetum coccineum]